MTAHKHAEMIKAKADNMELVVFCKICNEDEWTELDVNALPRFKPENDYFLCLPKHNEDGQCLHWLNGGDVLVKSKFVTSWEVVFHGQVWGDTIGWMREDAKYRIKTRKEKLWLAVKTDKHEHLGGCRKVRICSHAFVNKHDAEDYLDLRDSQLIEIEVEV